MGPSEAERICFIDNAGLTQSCGTVFRLQEKVKYGLSAVVGCINALFVLVLPFLYPLVDFLVPDFMLAIINQTH